MLLYLRLLKESFRFAISELSNNKLRTFLSVLGITIGIFSIIAVLASVDSLKRNVKQNLETIDNSTIYLTRLSFGPSTIPQWKRQQFPNVTYDEYNYIKKNMPYTSDVAFTLFVNTENIKFEDKTVAQVNVVPVSFEFYDIQSFKFDLGRFYTESESNSGAPVIVLGKEISNSLFGGLNPIGKVIRIYGQRATVIGVLQKQGSSIFGSQDETVYLPTNFVRRIVGTNNSAIPTSLIIKPDGSVDTDEYLAVLKQNFRNYRGLSATDEDNFFINQLAGFTKFIDNITGQMSIIGFVISMFSLLVGGFGIANIMFVSVKERTSLIGIQKSLGAKNRFILLQFLFEAMILSVIGGLVGLFLVWIASLVASVYSGDFEFILSLYNMAFGTIIAAIIGLISGILPAISASRLDPVEAIRTGM